MNQNQIGLAIAGVMPAARATGLFVSLATFKVLPQTEGSFTDSGFPKPDFTLYQDVPGLVGIPCMAPPSALGPAIQAKEQKSLSEILALNMSHVLLDDYYPGVDAVWRQQGIVNIDGIDYDILGVESDSQDQMTRVEVRLASE